MLEAQAEAESATADADADADIMGKQASTRAAAYKELRTQVKAAAVTPEVDLSADQLLAYIFLDGIRDNDQSAITLGLDEPADLQ